MVCIQKERGGKRTVEDRRNREVRRHHCLYPQCLGRLPQRLRRSRTAA
ncbi:MAG TPA: hypothetical protein VJ969_02535 [Desulfopila sp.]|nr:hypothetical protein [Desulfopila sp.]